MKPGSLLSGQSCYPVKENIVSVLFSGIICEVSKGLEESLLPVEGRLYSAALLFEFKRYEYTLK